MDSGHQTLLQSKLIIDDLGQRRQTVCGTRGVGNNIHGRIVSLSVDSHDKHRGICRWSRDNNLRSSSLHVGRGLIGSCENTCRLNNVVNICVTPLNVFWVHLFKDLDSLAVDGDVRLVDTFNRSRVRTVSGIVLEHVLHVFGTDEGVVDSLDVDHGVVLGGPHDETSNTSKAVDTNIDRLQALGGSLAVDDIREFGLQRSSTDQETIDVRLFREARGGLRAGRSTVQDTSVGRNVSPGNLSKVFTDGSMCLLCLFRRGCKTSPDSPDRFVRNDNLLPILLREDISVCLDLGEDEVVRRTGFTVLEGLATACDDRKTLVQRVLGLGGNFSIRFTLSTTFGMAHDDPSDAHIGEHIRTRLTCEGTVALSPDILCSDTDVRTETLLDRLQVDLRRTDDDFSVRRKTRLVQHRDKFLCLGNTSVTFPVSSNEELPGLDTRRRRVGTSSGLANRSSDRVGRHEHGGSLCVVVVVVVAVGSL
mmetsp:Transcript_45142/g.109888  ORF Transcript_45142/g.109888 Transcript_45142/m.109888 type:complete len:476 (-) Transcript_45142:42-1469(-)